MSVELDRARKLLKEAHSEETMAAAKGQVARLKAEVERLNALQRDSVHVSERDALDSELAQVRRRGPTVGRRVVGTARGGGGHSELAQVRRWRRWDAR